MCPETILLNEVLSLNAQEYTYRIVCGNNVGPQ